MREAVRISFQMKQAFMGEAWHGPAVAEMLPEIGFKKAVTKPLATAHSIWEIVLHLLATQRVIANRLGGIALELSPEEDWPSVNAISEDKWESDLRKLIEGDEDLRACVAVFPDDQLDLPLVAGGSSAYNNFHGYVQHTVYHLAQIGLLSKMIEEHPAP